MSDALGVRLLDRQPDMAAETLGRHQAWRQFAGMQADVHPRIEAMQEADHAHVLLVVGHRDGAVFGHHEVDAHDARISGGHLKAEQRLREDLLLRKSAQHAEY